MTVFLFTNNLFSEPGWIIIITTTANIIMILLLQIKIDY